MMHRVAVSNYRSLFNLVIPIDQLNVITEPNGCAKSNVYRALRLLAETAQGGVILALAGEGGLPSTFGLDLKSLLLRCAGGQLIQGGPRSKPQRLRLSFCG